MLFLPLASAAAQESRVLRGIVSDPAGHFVPWANVTVLGTTRRTVTDDSGKFRFGSLTGGTLVVRRMGFEPAMMELTVVPDTVVRIVLQPLVHQLSRFVIEAARSRSLEGRGFYDRMRDVEHRGVGHGYFITPEDIDRSTASLSTDLLRNVPAVEMVKRGLRVIPSGIDGCGMTVYLDGVRLNSLNGAGNGILGAWVQHGTGMRGVGGTDEMDMLTSPNSIGGIEVYPRAVGAPPRYQSLNGNCGVILIWSR